MRDGDEGPRLSGRAPVDDQVRQIVDQTIETFRIFWRLVASRKALSAPIEGSDVPAAAMPILITLKIFLDKIASTASEQKISA